MTGKGARLKQFRLSLQLNQEGFGELIGASQENVSNYETERLLVPFDIVALLIKKKNLNALWLAYGEGQMTINNTEPSNSELLESIRDLIKKKKNAS